MSEAVVGSVAVEVVPSAGSFGRKLRDALVPDADRIGTDVGRTLSERIRSSMGAPAVKVDTAAAKVDVDKLGVRIKQLGGTAKIKVDTSDFDARISSIKARLAEIQNKKLSVAVDAAAADAKLLALSSEAKKLSESLKSKADIDVEAAKARLAEIGVQIASIRDAKVQVRVDTAAANTRAATLKAELDAVTKDRRFKVEVDTSAANAKLAELKAAEAGSKSDSGSGAAAGGVSGLALAALSLGPALIPVAAAAIPLIAGIGTAAVGAGAGVGVLALAFHGISGAVSALGAQSQQTGQQLAQQAATQLASQDSILNAQAAVKAAVVGVADARRAAALSVRNAENGVVTAEQALTAAQYAETQAQVNLSLARKQAAQTLQDLTNSVKDGALTQRQASLDLQNAQQNLTVVDFNPHSTPQQRAEAQLAVDQAKQHLSEVELANTRLVTQKAAADKLGVSNAPTVLAAEHAVADATLSRQNAQQGLVRAQAAAVEAQRSGTESIVKADEQVVSSQRALEQAYASAGAQGSSAANAVAVAMAGLSPAGRAFAYFIHDTLMPVFKTFTSAAQTGFLPGLEAAIKTLLPFAGPIASFIGGIAKVLGDMAQAAAKALTGPFWTQFFTFIAQLAGPSLQSLGAIIGNLAEGFAGLFQALAPSAGGMGGGLVAITKAFSDWATHLGTNQGFQKFLQFVKDNAPAVGQFLENLAIVVGKLLIALAPLGAVLVVVIEKLTAFLATLTPGQLIALAAGIGAITLAIMVFTGGPVLLIGAAIAAIVGGLVYAYTHFKTFHDVVDTVVHAVAKYFTWLWQSVLSPTFKFISDNWHYVATAFRFEWDQVLRPMLTAFGEFVMAAWNDVLKPTFGEMRLAWQVMAAAFHATYNSVLKPVWSAFTTAFSSVSRAFGGFRDGLSKTWAGIKSIFIDGYNFVTQNVLNKFIDSINKVTSVLGVPKILDIGKLSVGAVGSSAHPAVGGGRPAPTFAHGGVVPGYGPGQDTIHAMLSPGEGVLVPEAVQGLGARFVHWANRHFSNRPAASDGRHFAGGGILGSIISGAGNILGGVGGSILSGVESPIKSLINGMRPDIAKYLAQGGFASIDNAIRTFLHLHPPVSGGSSSATVSGPNSGTALDYAKIIVQQAKQLNLGVKGAEIGLMTALVESNLKNYANVNIPESLRLPHDAVGSDHFSAGLFQQQTGPFGNYWGSIAQVMNPAYSAHRFFDELVRKVPGWQNQDSGVDAQTVQVSAFPDAYSARRGDADNLLKAIGYDNGGYLKPGVTQVYNGTGRPEPVFTDAQWAKLATGGGKPAAAGKIAETVNIHGLDADTVFTEFARRQYMAGSA